MPYTQLSISGVPGKRYSFSSKEELPTVEVISTGGYGTSDYPRQAFSMWDDPIPTDEKDKYKLLRQEDREIFEILETLTLSGIL